MSSVVRSGHAGQASDVQLVQLLGVALLRLIGEVQAHVDRVEHEQQRRRPPI